MDIKKAISEIDINIDDIADSAAKSIIIHLLNKIFTTIFAATIFKTGYI